MMSAYRGREGEVPGSKSLILDFEITKIGGFRGSAVCNRIVRLVLGDMGFGI